MNKLAEKCASDIGALLHGGQRAPDRYSKLYGVLQQYRESIIDDLAEQHKKRWGMDFCCFADWLEGQA